MKGKKPNGEEFDYGDVIRVNATSPKFKLKDRLRILFGTPVMIYVNIFTQAKVKVVHKEARSGVGIPKQVAIAKQNLKQVMKKAPVLLLLLFLSCTKEPIAPIALSANCANVTIMFYQYDDNGSLINSWVGWQAEACGDDLKGFEQIRGQYVCSPTLYREINISYGSENN